MTIAQARNVLGEYNSNYSDQEITNLINTMNTLASICLNKYLDSQENANEGSSCCIS